MKDETDRVEVRTRRLKPTRWLLFKLKRPKVRTLGVVSEGI